MREHCEYRAWAPSPHSLSALPHLLHDLVAVARPLGQQQQRGRADVAAAGPAARAEWTPARCAEGKASSPPRAVLAMAPAASVGAAVRTGHRAPQSAEVIQIAAPAAR